MITTQALNYTIITLVFSLTTAPTTCALQ